MAPDDEQAAWNALSLSESLGCPLVDVYRREKRVSEQLAECVRHTLRSEFAEIEYETVHEHADDVGDSVFPLLHHAL